jgi:hypothetical protein
MWFAALAPALSAALGPLGSAGPWGAGEVCSSVTGLAAAGQALVRAPVDGDSAGFGMDLSSCGYCLLGAHLAPPATGPLPLRSAATLPAPYQPPAAQALIGPAWVLLPSRAPPSLG